MEKEAPFVKEDIVFEMPLRPNKLVNFTGQCEIKKRLEVVLGAAKKRKEPLPHALFFGPPGLGKTTLAHLLAHEMGSSIILTSGPMLEKPSDLAGVLTNLQEGDLLFIDEIHRIHRSVEEYLYPAMEDYALDIMIDSGAHARTVRVNLNRFTLIGATTRSGLLSSPMRSRFGIAFRLDYYPCSDLREILARSSEILKIAVEKEALEEIAKRARGTPRVANHLLRWVRDYALMKGKVVIDAATASQALHLLAIDERGLDEMDKKILEVIIDHHEGGPVGINTLSVALGEESETIEETYEPFLILQGLIKRTPRGRMATSLAYEHLKKVRVKNQKELFKTEEEI